MLNLIRIAAVTGRVDPGSPAGCRKYLTEEIKKAGAHSPDVILLPSDILLPPSAQSLRRQGFMLDLCRQELSRLCTAALRPRRAAPRGLPARLGSL